MDSAVMLCQALRRYAVASWTSRIKTSRQQLSPLVFSAHKCGLMFVKPNSIIFQRSATALCLMTPRPGYRAAGEAMPRFYSFTPTSLHPTAVAPRRLVAS
jgi:hypothetical protein